MKTLHLECEPGEAAHLNWTVPMDAPDLLYYQVCIYFYIFHKHPVQFFAVI